MHPAPSILLFSTLAGAGYGLLFVLSLALLAGLLPPDPLLGLIGMGSALALITAGLLCSLGHLRRPERAWRAISQWRSSWLSGAVSRMTRNEAEASLTRLTPNVRE